MAQEMSLISILMAVYEPRMDWLREQLESLNVQTYPNLELIVCDDCSQTVPFESLCNLVKECITAFPVRMLRNEQNVGSNRTFEAMTKEATGQYVAYCDQDDIWYPEKLTVLERAASQPDVSLVCSDMEVVDENGKKTANSITQVRRHHVFHEGREQAEKLLFHNWVTGCTVLLPTALAKAAVTYGMDLMLAVMEIGQGMVSQVLKAAGVSDFCHRSAHVGQKPPGPVNAEPLYIFLKSDPHVLMKIPGQISGIKPHRRPALFQGNV